VVLGGARLEQPGHQRRRKWAIGREVERALPQPMVAELVGILENARLAEGERAIGYDLVVVDTAPTGPTAGWSAATVTPGLFHVACPAISLCVADGIGGIIATSTNPTGGASAWTSTRIAGANDLYGISCPSVSLCVAVDGKGDVITSTNPTAGAGAWKLANVDGTNFMTGISCPSISLCVADDSRGNVITSTDPTANASAWKVADVDGTSFMAGISCPSATLCVTGDLQGKTVTTTNPTGGATAWTVTQILNIAGFQGASCPTTTLCVLSTNGGQIVTSTNPAGEPANWTTTIADPIPNQLCATGRGCVTEQISVHDNAGTRVIDNSNTPSPGMTLGHLKLTGNTLTWTHDGTAHQITLQ